MNKNLFIRKNAVLLGTVFLFVLVFFSPVGVFAEGEARVNLLEPEVLPSAAAAPTLSQYLSGIFTRGLQIAALLSVVMLAYAGAEYVSSSVNPAGKEDAKKRIRGTLLGLLLALSGYLILRIINPDLVTFKEGFIEPLERAPTSASTQTSSAGGTNKLGLLVPSVSSGFFSLPPKQTASLRKVSAAPAKTAAIAYSGSEAGVRRQIESSGITIKTARPCSSGETYRDGCTNLAGLPATAITGLSDLKKDCNCSIVLTGGTEGGHKTHGYGKAVVDLRKSPELTKYIQASATKGNRTSVGQQWSLGGDTYVDEGDHWHVIYR